MKSFDLNHLTVFTKIVETGSLTKAAKTLQQPKSRVSRILSNLERDLGVELIHRTTRHLQLTEIGKRFYERCRGPLTGLEEAARDLEDCTTEVQGHIRVTAAQDFGNTLLAPMIDEFQRSYPKVTMDLLLTQESLNLVEQSIDLAIRLGALKDSGLKAHKVADLNILLVASPVWLEANPTLHQLEDLEKVECLGFLPFGSKWTFQNGREKKVLKITSRLSTNNPELILQFALRAKGPALLPDYLCRSHLQAGSLVPLFKSWKGSSAPIHLVFPYQKQMPQHVRRFADYLIPKIRAQF